MMKITKLAFAFIILICVFSMQSCENEPLDSDLISGVSDDTGNDDGGTDDGGNDDGGKMMEEQMKEEQMMVTLQEQVRILQEIIGQEQLVIFGILMILFMAV